jgi:PPP family 3-phenylpropionic acid transporter
MISIGYVWFFAGIAAFTPFAAIYYRSLDFTSVQVGILAAMPAIALSLTAAMWGAVADTLAAHRLILRTALGLGALLALLSSRADGFWLMFLGITLLSFSTVPLRSLMDHFAVLIGDRVGRPFGRIRLWGAFGYTTFALTLGRLMNEQVTSFFLVAYSISLLLTLTATFALPQLPAQHRRPMLEGVGELVRNRRLMLVLLVAFAQSVAAFMIVASLGYHITSMGGNASQVGVAFAVAAISELPVFLIGAWLYRRVGPDRLIAIIVLLYAVRMLLLAVVDSSGGVIALQAMHGLTFGGFLVVCIPRAHQLAVGRHPATVQALLTMAAFGLGNVVGSFLGGALLDHTRAAYVGVAVLMLAVLAVYGVFTHRWDGEASIPGTG